MDEELKNKIRATREGRSISKPNFLAAPVTQDIARGVAPTIKKIPSAIGSAAESFTQRTDEIEESLPDWAKKFTPFVRGADLAKTLVQETAAGGLSLVKSGLEASGIENRSRDNESQRRLEENLFGREVNTIQEQYLEPIQQITEERGSGRLEKLGLGTAAVGLGLFAESPLGRMTPGSRGVFRNLLKDDVRNLSKDVDVDSIVRTLESRGIQRNALTDKSLQRIANATTPRQVGRALDDAESQLIKDTEIAPRVAERAAQKVNQQPEVNLPRRVTPEAQPIKTPEEPTTRKSATAQESRQNMRDRVKATLDEQEYIDREVIPGVKKLDGTPAPKPTPVSKPLESYIFYNNRKELTDDVVRQVDELNIKPKEPVTLWREGEVDPGKLQSWTKNPDYFDNPISRTVTPDEILVDTTDNRFRSLFTKDSQDALDKYTSLENEVIVKPSTGRGATGPAGQPASDSAPAATRTASLEQQPVPTPPKTTTNSEILDSLEQSNPKQAQKASKEYTDYKQAVDKTINSNWNGIREQTQDAFIRMRKLQQEVADGKAVPDDINVDQAETLFHGRVQNQLEEIGSEVRTIDASMVRSARETNTPVDEFRTDVDSYLHATHAPERNAKLGDGAAGMTDADAQKTIDALKATGRYEQIQAEANKLLQLNNKTLDILLEGQLIDEATHKLLRDTYKNHVPLMRVMSETEDMTSALSGKGFDVKASGLKKAKGSDREVADITGNIVQTVEQAIIRSEKNLVNLTTARWARENKDLGIIKEIKPRAVGKKFDGETPILENLSEKPNIISFREGGKQKYLEVQDARLAKALKGVNVENVPTMFRGVAYLTRLYGQLHTRFNYEFAFSNAIRDSQEMAVELAGRSGMGFGSAGKAVARVPQSQKAVADFIFGRDTEGARLYRQMREDGGTTGGLGLSSRQDIDMEIQRIQEMNQKSPKQAAEAALRAVDKWNMVFEDGTRLAAYKSALDSGLSRKQAAVVAKESTINFNKKGTSGPMINGMWMFSNASIQGTTKVLRRMKDPKIAAAVTMSLASAVEVANQWNDNVDPEWRDKVTKWDRSSNLVIMFPTEGEDVDYMTIPVSWGLKPVKMTVEYASDLARGEIDVVDGAAGILTSVLQSYNPLAGDESLLRTLTPTVLKTPVEISSNRAWHGNQIKPAYDVNAPASSQYFSSLENSLTGRASIAITESLSNRGVVEVSPADVDYAFNQYIGGVGRSISKISGAIANIGSDDPLPANQRPVLSRFFKTRTQEQVYTDMFYTKREQADKDQARERVLDKRRVQPIYEEVQILAEEGDTAEAQAIVDSLSEEDYEVYKKLRATDMRRQNVGAQIQQYSTVREVEDLVNQGKREEAQQIVEKLSDEEYEAYQDAKNALGVEF